jgi:Rrf2 family transcriptional regulator, cysteine metabolism repressor
VKISTKGQYALEALIDLRMHATNGQENLKNVAVRRGISEPYLEQIFATLRKAGIVESKRGAQGGYKLAREPMDITAGDILRTVEGPLYPVKCVGSNPGDENRCLLYDGCVTRMLWASVAFEINGIIDGITLENLVHHCIEISGGDLPEYRI